VSTPTAIVIGVGAQRGLGAAICRRFAAERYHVFVAGRTTEKIEHVVRTIVETGGSAEFWSSFVVAARRKRG
jgi:NAD(P)-dependent dehydrogenase (short-subunit alcohol dehydrogenase family)